MKHRDKGMRLRGSLFGCLFLCLSFGPSAWAQQTGGSVSVVVLTGNPSKSEMPSSPSIKNDRFGSAASGWLGPCGQGY